MADKHEEHGSLIQTPKQLIMVVVLAFVVPITLIVMLTQLITTGADTSKGNLAMSEEAIAKRIRPVGDVVVDPTQPAPAAAAPAPQVAASPAAAAVPAAAAKGDAGKGKSVFDAACTVANVRPRVLLESGAPQTLVALAREGYGVAVLPSNTAMLRAGLRARPIVFRGVPVGRWLTVSWDRRRFLPRYAERFVDDFAAAVRRAYPGRDLVRRAPPLPRLAAR